MYLNNSPIINFVKQLRKSGSIIFYVHVSSPFAYVMCKLTVPTRHNRKRTPGIFSLFRTDLILSSLLPIFIVAIPTELQLNMFGRYPNSTYSQFAWDSISFVPDFNEGRKHVKRIKVCLNVGLKV